LISGGGWNGPNLDSLFPFKYGQMKEEDEKTINNSLTCFMLVSCLAYFSTLNMEASCSSETSVDFQLTKRRYIPENRTLHNHRCDNLKSYINLVFSGG
jgi:hypothetical protein